MDDATEAATAAEIVGPVVTNQDYSDASLAAAHSVLDEKVTSLIPPDSDRTYVLGKDGITCVDATGQPLPPDHQPDPETMAKSLADIETGRVSTPQEIIDSLGVQERPLNVARQDFLGDMLIKAGMARNKLPPVSINPFVDIKEVTYKDGPADGLIHAMEDMPSDGLICFFCESSPGIIQQAVYRIILKEIEPTDEEKAAAKEKNEVLAKKYEWVGEYMGKRRHTPPQNVNGCRKV